MKVYPDAIDKSTWSVWREVTKTARLNEKLVKAMGAEEGVALLTSEKPPYWCRQWYYTEMINVFGESPGLLLMWLTYLEWRHTMHAQSRNPKYELYKAQRGLRQELTRFLGVAGGRAGELPDRAVRTRATELIITGISHQWAGLPRAHWLERVPIASLGGTGARSVGRRMGDRWNEIVRSITETGQDPTGQLDEDQVMELALALATADRATIDRYHTSVMGAMS